MVGIASMAGKRSRSSFFATLFSVDRGSSSTIFAGSAEALDQQIHAARSVGAHVFWHANAPGETPPREVAGLHERGMLASDITFVHMAGTEEDEWRMLSDCGASVAFTPDTELQMGMMYPSSATAKGCSPRGAFIVRPTEGAAVTCPRFKRKFGQSLLYQRKQL